MDIQSGFAQNARRKVLNAGVGVILYEAGFASAEKGAVESLVEMLQGLICEMGRSSRAAAELAGRTEVLVGDVVLALVEMGIDVDSIPAYGRSLIKPNRSVVQPPAQAPRQPTPKILQAGEKRQHFSYIPEYLPPFPDPHSYIRTPTHKQPVTEYEAIREKSATQKRDVERALTRFMAKTSEQSSSHSLFPDDHMSHLFPLISLKTSVNCYLNALLPKDQVFEGDEDEDCKPPEETTMISSDPESLLLNSDQQMDTGVVGTDTNGIKVDSTVPDNPYVRQPKVSKKRRL